MSKFLIYYNFVIFTDTNKNLTVQFYILKNHSNFAKYSQDKILYLDACVQYHIISLPSLRLVPFILFNSILFYFQLNFLIPHFILVISNFYYYFFIILTFCTFYFFIALFLSFSSFINQSSIFLLYEISQIVTFSVTLF